MINKPVRYKTDSNLRRSPATFVALLILLLVFSFNDSLLADWRPKYIRACVCFPAALLE